MSKHLHSRTEYCWCCSSIATHRCKVCGNSICMFCSAKYHGKCDICIDDIKEENLMLGSMDNGYEVLPSSNPIYL